MLKNFDPVFYKKSICSVEGTCIQGACHVFLNGMGESITDKWLGKEVIYIL